MGKYEHNGSWYYYCTNRQDAPFLIYFNHYYPRQGNWRGYPNQHEWLLQGVITLGDQLLIASRTGPPQTIAFTVVSRVSRVSIQVALWCPLGLVGMYSRRLASPPFTGHDHWSEAWIISFCRMAVNCSVWLILAMIINYGKTTHVSKPCSPGSCMNWLVSNPILVPWSNQQRRIVTLQPPHASCTNEVLTSSPN